MKLLIKLLALSLLTLSCGRGSDSNSGLNFYGADSRETKIQFQDYFLFPTKNLKDPLTPTSSGPELTRRNKMQINKALKLQTLHLYGVFSYHEKPIDFSSYSGSIMERGTAKITGIRRLNADYLQIAYTYEDRAIFYYELFQQAVMDIKFLMPNSPTEIYAKGFPARPKKSKDGELINPCTSEYDNSEKAFWYYWSPDRKGCPAAFRKELHYVTARLTQLPATKLTYPEYEKLYAQNRGEDGRGKVRVDLIVGPDQDMTNPKDLGRVTFEHTFNYFTRMRTPAGKPTFNLVTNTATHKLLTYRTNLFDANVHIHYLDPDAPEFLRAAASVLRHSDLFIFSGHSYEGKYFDLQRVFNNGSRALPKTKYQIMFFNACTTYAYYNFNYFKAKQSTYDPRGTKFLDLMTNGIGSPFLLDTRKRRPTQVTDDIITISSILGLRLDGQPLQQYRSWQEILGRITANSGYDFTGLTNVMGDEDNPTSPPKFATPRAL